MNLHISTIGILSPSSSPNPERLNKGLSILEERGFKTVVHPQTTLGMDTDTQYAGSPEQKAAAFMDLWTNPDINTIMASCGGNFSSQFLHHLDYKIMSKTPKTLIGFSDTTALLSALYSRTGIGGVFGPTVQSLGRNDDLDVVFNILTGKSRLIDFSDCIPLSSIEKTNQSPLYAATLSVLLSLAGTAYFPNLSGHILILEDIGEELSHLDRMLWQLNQICPFDHLTGLVFGDFTDLKDSGRPLGLDYQGVIRKHTQGLKIPVLINAPVGHGTRFIPIPLGVSAQLENASTGLRLIF